MEHLRACSESNIDPNSRRRQFRFLVPKSAAHGSRANLVRESTKQASVLVFELTMESRRPRRRDHHQELLECDREIRKPALTEDPGVMLEDLVAHDEISPGHTARHGKTIAEVRCG